MLAIRVFASVVGVAVSLAIASSAAAQVVQLPTYNFSGVGTTVSVPDGGEILLGGIYRASEGSTSRGVPFVPFKNRGIGRSVGASTMSLRATIIDHAAMDEALLAEAAARRAAMPYGPYKFDPVVASKASYLSAHVGRTDGSTGSSAPPPAPPSQPASGAPHAAAQVHASAAQKTDAAANLADKLFRSEVELGKGSRGEANP